MQYDLVFEGGGAKGMVFVGALRVFEEQGHTFGRLLGTSAGAITATLLAAGYPAPELLTVLNETRDGRSVFEYFMGTPQDFAPDLVQHGVLREFLRKLDLPFIPNFLEEKIDAKIVNIVATNPRFSHIFSFLERGGWFSADAFVTWMREKLSSGTFKGQPRNFGNMTLSEFYAATRVDLSLVASDTTSARLLVLNRRTAPDCPVVWAVRMSMNIPLLWQEVVWQAEWGQYREQVLTGHTIVDGGLLSNFPIELFVSDLPSITAVMGPKVSENVLGYLIDDNVSVPGGESDTISAQAVDAQAETGVTFDSLRTVQRLTRLLNTMLQAHDKMVLDAFSKFVVRLPAKGYGTTEFDMSDERKSALVAAGEETMQDFLMQAQGGGAVSFSVPAEADDGLVFANKIASKLLA